MTKENKGYENIIRNYFYGWEKKDWDSVKNSLADGFTFTSPYDNHINLDEYEQKCWNSAEEIEKINIIKIIENSDEAFVRYKGSLKGGKLIQNTEYFKFQDGKIKEIDVFFGRP